MAHSPRAKFLCWLKISVQQRMPKYRY